ncbi:MAG TPA: aldehyde dehydrogenase family protein, partial [Steroidobacteraceae bacterium]|nr:aldehyde dehydrogenase family protein [Steroidobacteraceae bacterium]
MSLQRTVSPVDGSVYVERELASAAAIEAALARAVTAQLDWRAVAVNERAAICRRFCDAFEQRRDAIALELTWQMGRPIRYAANEVRGTLERARYMIDIAPEALADLDAGPKDGFLRFVRREPLGVVFTVAAWNYPYLIAVNSVVPAIMAGNAVVLKHSAQTPLCAERFAECFHEAGLPEGVFQFLHLSHEDTERVAKDSRVAFIAFTGSVAGGHAIQRAVADRFVGTGLELGGCDPAYVRHDANLPHAIENIVDGAFFNSGQSCCGLQRIYVHETVYDRFVEGAVAFTKQYVLGTPTDSATTLGPVVRAAAAEQIRRQIAASVASGAQPAIDERDFPASRAGTPYVAPQLLLNVDHRMSVMREEIFGPVAG